MTVTPCEATKIEYAGNGRTTRFSFPFSYLHFYDVKAALWDDDKKEYITQTNLYILSDASTVEFLTAPPAPPAGTPNGLNVRIYRGTDLDTMQSTFYPGSSIRAQDLNDNFDQVRFSVQETQCDVESNRKDLEEQFWGKFGIGGRGDLATAESPYDTMYRADVIKGRWYGDTEGYEIDQDAVPTTGAVSARLDPFVQGTLPPSYVAETNGLLNDYNPSAGKRWVNTDDCWESYWDPTAKAWVAYVNTGPRGPQGDAGVQGDQGIPGPSLLIKGILPAGDWVEPDPKQPGDIWIAGGTITNFPYGGTPVEEDAIAYNGESWVNTGPIGIQGQKGDKGDTGDQGIQGIQGIQGTQGIQGIQGPIGETGQGLVFKGQVSTSTNLPTVGNEINDAWQAIDTGHYWVWTGAVWVDVGSVVQGPTGPQGPVMDISTLPSLPA